MTDSELAQMKRDIQILKDTEAVKKVKHAYFRCIDMANLDELRELLHPKIHAKLVGGTYSIEFNTREDYIEMVANSFHAEFVGQHNGHHPEIEILSETEATGRTDAMSTSSPRSSSLTSSTFSITVCSTPTVASRGVV